MRFFIAGTDTGVGKTRSTALLAHALGDAGHEPVALKPVCSGPRDDAEILRAACANRLSLDEVNPFWFPLPVAPHVAARAAGTVIAMEDLKAWYRRVTASRGCVLVEGAGGWLVPLAPGLTMADLAVALDLPVILVVANRLGCINHTLLTLESVRARGLTCAGLILNSLPGNDTSMPTNRQTLLEFADTPVLLEISAGQTRIDLPSALARQTAG